MKENVFDTRLPIYVRLRDQLAQKIVRQEWRPGEAVPAEYELAKASSVAIGTVRKAIEILVAEGLLERFQGKGTFVRRAKFDGSLFRFFRFESENGERVIPKSRILTRDVIKPPPTVASALGLSADSTVIRMKRLRLVDEAPMLSEEIWLPFDRFSELMSVEIEELGDLLYPEYERHCGQIVASAHETLTVAAVTAPEARLLNLQVGTPVVVIERVAFGYDRNPLEWRRSRGPANHFRYHVEIR